MFFLFLRHWSTAYNERACIAGQHDPPLSDRGVQQGFRFVRGLKERHRHRIGSVSCSDFQRGYQCGKFLAEAYELQPLLDSRLREVNVGPLEGLGWEDARARFAAPRHQLFVSKEEFNHQFDFSDIGGESSEEALLRHVQFIEAFRPMALCTDKNARHVVIGHGIALRLLFHHYGLPYTLKQGTYQVVEFRAGCMRSVEE